VTFPYPSSRVDGPRHGWDHGAPWFRRGPPAAPGALDVPVAQRPAAGTIVAMDADAVRTRLEEERSRLAQLRADFVDQGLTSESENDSLGELSSVDQHQADVGTETFHREADLSILEQVQAELAEVEHALHRLDDGSYGTCEACGRSIDEGRLEAVPAARFCLDDQARAEREVRLPGGRS